MPVALAVVGIALSVTSAVGGGIMAYQQGKSEEEMNKYNQAVAKQQAMLAQRTAEQNVRLTQTEAAEDTKQLQRKYMVLAGEQRAARAASGIGGGSVSEGDIATDLFRTQKLDESTVRYNADVASWGINNQAALEKWGLSTQATQYGMAAKQARKAGNIGLATGILGGASSVAKGYYDYKGYGKGK